MDYQGNSNKKKKDHQEKKVEKVVTGDVVTRKQSNKGKVKSAFLGGEFKGALRYITADVLLPAFRNLMVDATTKGIERIVYGETNPSRRPTQYSNRVQYNNPIRRDASIYMPDQAPKYRTQVKPRSNEIILASREEAEKVLERLIDIAERYEVASLADLYELCGLQSAHTDNKWGWTYLNNAEIIQIREGHLLSLPEIEQI